MTGVPFATGCILPVQNVLALCLEESEEPNRTFSLSLTIHPLVIGPIHAMQHVARITMHVRKQKKRTRQKSGRLRHRPAGRSRGVVCCPSRAQCTCS
jgi:hypothetical protein